MGLTLEQVGGEALAQRMQPHPVLEKRSSGRSARRGMRSQIRSTSPACASPALSFAAIRIRATEFAAQVINHFRNEICITFKL